MTTHLEERLVAAMERIASALEGKVAQSTTEQVKDTQTALVFDAEEKVEAPKFPTIPPIPADIISRCAITDEPKPKRKPCKRFTGQISVFDTKEGKGYVFPRLKEAKAQFGWASGGQLTKCAITGCLYMSRYKITQMR